MISAMHSDPSVWKTPEKFDPTRFCNGGEADDGKATAFLYIPFSAGPRNCTDINDFLNSDLVQVLERILLYWRQSF
jgi:hypothetical protein